MKTTYKNCELEAKREMSLGGEKYIYWSAFDLADGYEITSGFGDYSTCLEAIGGLKSHVDEYKSDPEQYEKDTHELSMLMGGLD
ncbi:MAG: hypothetical protein PHX74_08175 [Candidatus Sumerlaeales bacterium]|jgi:hypothetical protein|nr:hypothetical protein [Candidatus Sumerlaeales bacterium]